MWNALLPTLAVTAAAKVGHPACDCLSIYDHEYC
jgi:hypothetical protein